MSKDNPMYIFGRHIPPEAVGMTMEEDIENRLVAVEKSEGVRGVTPEFLDTKIVETDMGSLYNQNNIRVRNTERSMIAQPTADIRIRTPHPVSVTHIGDTHVGHVATNLREVVRKMRTVRETPNLFTVFMGNMVDNAIPAQFPDGMLQSTMEPEQQLAFMRHIVKDLNEEGKILAAVASPCHEGWTYKKAGQDVNKLIYDVPHRKFPVLENGGEVEVQVGRQEYRAAFYHQTGPFNSNFNETHAVKQMHRLNLQMDKDWVAAAHNHVGAVEQVFEGTGSRRRVVTYVRTGTEKGTGRMHDKFIQDRAGRTGEPTGQMVHLDSRRHNVDASLDFNTGVDKHRSRLLDSLTRRKK